MQNTELQGFLLINKPKDITSFDCIRKIKKALASKKIKIGHAGTLDPFATGLLIVGISRTATRHISQLMKLDKVYSATAKLGELTDTLDKTGNIIEQQSPPAISQDELTTILKSFGDGYCQTPPLFAALKYEGKPLYALARSKKSSITQEKLQQIVQAKQRMITIYKLDLINARFPFFTAQAHVSHGTYIRSLMNDIGQRAATYATTYELERTKIGPFDISHACLLTDIQTREDIEKYLIPIPDFITRLRNYLE